VPVDERCERSLGRLVAPPGEPLQQLSVGQRRRSPGAEQRPASRTTVDGSAPLIESRLPVMVSLISPMTGSGESFQGIRKKRSRPQPRQTASIPQDDGNVLGPSPERLSWKSPIRLE